MVFSPSGTMVALTSGPGERAALDAMPHLVWMTDREGARSYLNARWYEYTGLPSTMPDEVVWQRSVHPDDRSAILVAWGEPGADDPNELLFRVRRHDGAWRWFVMRIVPLGERGERTGWIATATDVDDLKRAELHQRDQAQVAQMARVVTDALAHRPSLAAALHTTVDALVVHLGAIFARVWTFDDGRLALAATAGRDPGADAAPRPEPAVETIARTATPHVTAELERDRGFAGADLGGATSFAGYPLLAGDAVVGVVAIYGVEPLPEDSQATVGSLADAMAVRIASQGTLDELRASEQRYALVTKATKDAIWDWDLASDRMIWNRGLVELVGGGGERTGGDGAWWKGNIHPDDRAAVVRSLHAVWDGGGEVWTAEYRFGRADGSYARVADRALIVRGDRGAPVRMVGAMRDVTAAWRAERSLRVLAEAGARLAAATNERDACQRAVDLVVPELADWGFVDVVRDDGRFERLGVAHRDRGFDPLLAQLAVEHPPGRGLPEGIDDPADPRLTGGLAWVVRTGRTEIVPRATDAALRAACQDQRHYEQVRSLGIGTWLRLPIMARGQTIGVLSLVRVAPDPAFDAEDEQLLIAIARRAGKFIDGVQLLAAAQRSEQELREVVHQLRRSNEDLDRFAYVAGHDLKAPLRGIAAISQWIQDDLGDRIAPATAEHLALLRSRVKVLEQLIDGALQFSRAGRGELHPEHVEVGPLVEGAFELLAPPAGAQLALVTPMPTVHTPRVLLQQVFLNLLGNAIKYGGGATARIEVGATDLGPQWAFTVRDHGPGIAPEHHERIWDLFQTLSPRDARSATGIGLAIVRKIVQRRGGETSVESALGAGATFRFTWPKE